MITAAIYHEVSDSSKSKKAMITAEMHDIDRLYSVLTETENLWGQIRNKHGFVDVSEPDKLHFENYMNHVRHYAEVFEEILMQDKATWSKAVRENPFGPPSMEDRQKDWNEKRKKGEL